MTETKRENRCNFFGSIPNPVRCGLLKFYRIEDIKKWGSTISSNVSKQPQMKQMFAHLESVKFGRPVSFWISTVLLGIQRVVWKRWDHTSDASWPRSTAKVLKLAIRFLLLMNTLCRIMYFLYVSIWDQTFQHQLLVLFTLIGSCRYLYIFQWFSLPFMHPEQ